MRATGRSGRRRWTLRRTLVVGTGALVAIALLVTGLATSLALRTFVYDRLDGQVLETLQIVQVDQKFKFHRPILDGDIVRGTMYIDSVDERFGADIVTSRNVLTDEKTGEVVMEAFTTLMGHQGEVNISASWDPVSGQVVRKPTAHAD